MKKIVLTLVTLLSLSATVGFAAPINDLASGQTAVGVGNNTFYLEHKFGEGFTLGLQNADWDTSGSLNDLYGQFHFSSNLRGIVGSKNYDSGSKMYVGLAVNGPIAPEWDGYATLVAGNSFKQMQIGANYKVSSNVDFNLDYHSFMPDWGNNRTGVGVGATLKF
jgi:hypothetical protein